MDAPDTNADQIAYWNDFAGQTWFELQDLLDVQLEPLGRRVIEALAPRAREQVLDVGCGCGQTTLALGGLVGPDGRAVGVDISRPMLEIARRRAEIAPQTVFLEADAQTYAFEPATFDAIHSRFGVMFFEDPTVAFANLRGALKPGGRMAFICWRSPAENPVMSLPMAAAAKFLPAAEPPTPGAPGPFAFADAERVRGILGDAGFIDVAIAPQDMPAGGNSLDDTVRLALRVGPLGRQLHQYPTARGEVIEAIRHALGQHLLDGRVLLPSATWIVTARNP
jgi:SAM-dependent methyltransferase